MENINTEKLENIMFWTRSADGWFGDMVETLARIKDGSYNDEDEFWTRSAIDKLRSGIGSLKILQTFV